ncbi:arsenate reductase family protein [Clostridium folliculivorans]|uniref:ArsC family transcriptional regulator n=1 Tax=Clostridium folliculivorans TaxID=2886038 RepID=A0A9W5Y785_9CLOT|nr:arsenate reductase family protein [Clostridium folliculivorans]GKU27817.1 ArsC family transcriptional regulator [Clostridium folliculivorans]GKU31834.1 ArsC family transcriptional regulator [Clostridium folliculivorans]
MAVTFIQYPKCSTCRKAKKWLQDNNIEFNERIINEDNPKKEELSLWIEKSGLPITKFFNTSGRLYKELNLKDKIKVASREELIDILASDGMLVKRPIVLRDDMVLVGFKEEQWEGQIK